LAVALGFVMAMLDVTVVNVALTHIQASLDMSLAGLVWVVDGYTLAFAALLLVGGALANRYGARNAYLAGLALFVAASALCGAAPTAAVLVGARLLQGLGAALFMPASLSLLNQAYPDDAARIRVLALWSAVVSVAAATGPLVGGIVVAAAGWRCIFWLNIPIGIVGAIMSVRFLGASPRHAQALNGAGHALAMTGLACIAFALIDGSTYGWTSAPILGAAALGGACLALFLRRERRVAAPIVPRELQDDRRFVAVNGVGMFINIAGFGGLFFVSLYLQDALHADAWHTGLALLPLMAMFTIGNLLSGRISARWSPRLTMLAGLSAAALLSAVLAAGAARMPYGIFAVLMALANLGCGLAVPAMTVTMMQLGGQRHANIAAAALNANRQVGVLVGVAAMGVALHGLAGWPARLETCFGLITLAYLAALLLVAGYLPAAAARRAAAH
jgi:DHA2 family methylenomycin A resistance protein-like MFS transporter